MGKEEWVKRGEKKKGERGKYPKKGRMEDEQRGRTSATEGKGGGKGGIGKRWKKKEGRKRRRNETSARERIKKKRKGRRRECWGRKEGKK